MPPPAREIGRDAGGSGRVDLDATRLRTGRGWREDGARAMSEGVIGATLGQRVDLGHVGQHLGR